MRGLAAALALALSLLSAIPVPASPFTQEDRARILRLEEGQRRLEKRLIRLEAILGEFKEVVDKRFEQVDKRFEQMMTFLWILAGIFTTLVAVVIGFAYWDRRTMIREARREAIEFMEKEGTLRRLLDAMKTLAEEDIRLREALRRFQLL